MEHGVDDTSLNSATNKSVQHHLVTPAFEHVAFPVHWVSLLALLTSMVSWVCLGCFLPTSPET